MKFRHLALILMLSVSMMCFTTACSSGNGEDTNNNTGVTDTGDSKNSVGNTGENSVDENTGDVADDIKDAADDVGEGVKDTADGIGNGVEDVIDGGTNNSANNGNNVNKN